MKTWIWLGLLLAGTAGVSPFLLEAQIFSDPCCHSCQLPVPQCHCQRTRPVVQTHLREEKVTTYKDVMETRFREECVVEHTPVTTYEDRVETVWVPQQVTKKVARTVMVPQTRSRTVPYHVMQRIPQTTTRMVPYQTVHHVTETVPMAYGAPSAPIITQSWLAPPMAAIPVGPAYIAPVPQTAVSPRRAPPLTPSTNSHHDWQIIPPHTSSVDQRYGGFDPAYERPVPTPLDNEPAVRRTSWRGNVPGAASAMTYRDRGYR